jgi:hypothetical protein
VIAAILLVALTGVALAAPTPAPPPTPPGVPHMVRMLSVESVPSINDTRVRSFLTGFRGTFLDESFVTERSAAREGEYAVSVPITNRFVLLMGSGDSPDAWQAQVTIEWSLSARDSAALRDSAAAGKRTRGAKSRREQPARNAFASGPARSGAVVTYWSLSPEAVTANARPIPRREKLVFEFPANPGSAFFREAGRRIALLVLEDLHHRSGDLDPEERLRLTECLRSAP